MKVKLQISYDGGPFFGWQKQPNEENTVQGQLEKALERVFDEPVNTLASGRTDAGVHALQQYVHFKSPKNPKDYNLKYALNSLTPSEIVVEKIWQAPEDFHALASATQKTYKYLILNSPTPHAFRHRYTTWIRKNLDLKALNELSQPLIGELDFASFQTKGTETHTTIRTLKRAEWRQLPDNLVEFTISGDGFLKQMVRNIVGTQLDLFRKGLGRAEMEEVLAAKDRRKALGTAPPQGLYLYRVEYPSSLDNKCREI